MSADQPRKPAGTPAGGEFANKTGSGPTGTLVAPELFAPFPDGWTPDVPMAVGVSPSGAGYAIDLEVSDRGNCGSFGDGQGDEFGYRVITRLSDGTWEVVDQVWTYADEVDENDNLVDVRVHSIRCTTTCLDPSDPGGTEISADYGYDEGSSGGESMAYWFPSDPSAWEVAARDKAMKNAVADRDCDNQTLADGYWV